MAFSFVPQELVRLIIEELKRDRATLCSLALTCRHLHFEAMRALYRSMTHPNGTYQYTFLLRLRKYPHLGKIVQVYHSPKTTNKQRGSLWSLIRACLPLMVNLQELDLFNVPGEPMKILPDIGKGNEKGHQAPFRLKKLRVAAFGHEKEVAHLLETQQELEHLHILSFKFEETISPQACPMLHTLYVGAHSAKQFLSGRPVTELGLRFGSGRRYDPAVEINIEEILSQSDTALVHRLAIDNTLYPWFSCRDIPDGKREKPFQNVEILQITQNHISGPAQVGC